MIKIKNKLSIFLIACLMLVNIAVIGASSTKALTEYEIKGSWLGSPTLLEPKDSLNAQWHISINDDQAAPENGVVENVVVTLKTSGGRFTSIPNTCQVSGVNPISSITDNGTTLICNVGSYDQGSSLTLVANVVADPNQGLNEISMSGEVGGNEVILEPVPVQWGFGMDMIWQGPSSYVLKKDGYVDASFEWSLALEQGSVVGPDSVSYDLNVTAANGSTIDLTTPNACTAFSSASSPNHPYSSDNGGANPSDKVAPFVGSCELVKTGANTFTLTLTGIDYSLLQVPTKSSNGTLLPLGWDVIASGQLWFKVNTQTNTSITVSSNAPTYISANGLFTTSDIASNNSATKTIAFLGNFSSAWNRALTKSGGTSWDDSYRIMAGTEVQSYVTGFNQVSPDSLNGRCVALDTKYTTYKDSFTELTFWDGTPSLLQDVIGTNKEYYIGNDPSVDPENSSYDIMNFDCNISSGWTSTVPSDLSTVKAVRITYPLENSKDYARIQFRVNQIIKETTPVGQDIWMFGVAYYNNKFYINSDFNGTVITPTPSALYSGTTNLSDILRIVSATPSVKKTADRSIVKPGVPTTFSLEYSANVTSAVSNLIDNFVIEDTLPIGMSYVEGSAEIEPTVTMVSNQQILSWKFDGLTPNTQYLLSYQAIAGEDAEVGKDLVNTVNTTIEMPNWPVDVALPVSSSQASVVQTTDGYTSIGKTTDQGFIPNPEGDGVGDGSWTVTIRSFDVVSQAFTDTIDVLPYNGDGRGTSFTGTYELTSVDALPGSTVYYTDVDPTTIIDDPKDAMNGSLGDPTGNTIEWTTEFNPNATAVRVIGPELKAGATQAFVVNIKTNGATGGDIYVNRAQARAEHTQLLMRTSSALPVADSYSASLKKYVQDSKGVWRDANAVEDYPTFAPGDTIKYRIVVENTGQGELETIIVVDDKQPELGSFTIASLASKETYTHEYSVKLEANKEATLVNTACATADKSPEEDDPKINCDPAGVEIKANAVTKPVVPTPETPDTGGKDSNKLPQTGVSNSPTHVMVLSGLLVLGGYLMTRRKEQ